MNPEIPLVIQAVLQALVPVVVVRGATIAYANEAANQLLMGDTGLPVVGMEAQRFVHPSDRDLAASTLKRVLETRSPPYAHPRTLIDGRGKPIPVQGMLMVIEWEGQPAIAAVFQAFATGDQPRNVKPGLPTPLAPLSPRERQIALLVAQGFAVQDIARLLGIQRETVRTHIKAVYRKTRTHTRVELTRMVLGARPRAEPRRQAAPAKREVPAGS